MKTTKFHLLIAILICLLLPITGFGQTEITYDYCTGKFQDKIKPIPTSEFVVLKIVNINTFRYEVEIKGKNINYATPVPSELQVLFRLPEGTSKDEIQRALSETSEGVGQLDRLHEAAKYESANAENQIDQWVRKEDEQLAKAKQKKLEEFEQVLNQLLESSRKYQDLAKKIATIQFSRIDLINISKQEWCNHAEMKNKLPSLATEQTMKADFLAFNAHYAQINTLYQTALIAAGATEQWEEKTKLVEKIYGLINASYNKLSDEDFLKMISELSILYRALDNQLSFEVTSPPIQVDGDYVRFEVTTKPVRVSDLMNFSLGKSFAIEVPARRGWKADFSVGPTFSMGRNAVDYRYNLQNETDSTIMLTKSKNRSVIFPAVAAMFHAYRRSGTEVNWGIMMGVGAGFKPDETLNASYYLGPTLILGKHQKIMFCAGVSFLPVSRLKSIYQNNGIYNSDLNLSDITEKVIKGSFFISLSYNLTNRIEVK
ncbi:MAG: hypothetical protein KF803_02565 [Cyclobacteriaceae bacterium]|nr:hypothetical protein [Cyclobacteriaceae bacterium]